MSAYPADRDQDKLDRPTLAIAWVVLLFVVVMVTADLRDGNWGGVIALLAAAFAWAMMLGSRRSWIRLGYQRGRWAAAEAAEEARTRGLDLDDFIISQLQVAVGSTLRRANPHE